MGKIENLFENVQGSIGNLIFYRRNNRNYVRSKPAQYRDRKSPGQLAQRQRLAVVNGFLKPFGELLRTSFASPAEGRTPRQQALSVNMRQALTGEYPNIRIDPSRAQLSEGPLPLPLSAQVSYHPEGLHIQWENGEEGAANDTLVVMALFEDKNWGEYQFTNTLRKNGEYTWKTSLAISQDALPQVWIAFRNSRMDQLSDSLYTRPME